MTGRITAAVAVGALAFPVVSTLVNGAGNGASAAPAANPALTCAAGTIYNLMTNGNFYALNTTTGVNTPAAPTTLGPSTSNDNALGISSAGNIAYSMNQTPSGGSLTLTITNVLSGVASNTTVTATNLNNNIAGGVDPANGNFYYGGWNSADTIFTAYLFNVTSSVATEVGTITPGGTLGSGDLAFDGAGDLYVLAGNNGAGQVDVVNASALPASGTAPLLFKKLTTLSGSGNFDGIAFAANSLLYAETEGGGLYVINPDTGATSTVATQRGYSGSPVDLASCAYNGTLTLEKNIVGRVGTGDQFGLSVTGGGIASGNTGTTSGSSTGLQTTPATAIAGPVVGIPTTVYTIAETAASGANLANYSSSYLCTNAAGGTFASGTGTSATLPAFPQPSGSTGAQIACTFKNTPASISVTKTPTPTTVNAAGNTVSYSFVITNTGPLALTKVGVSDAQATPSSNSNLGAITCGAGTNGSLTLAAGASATCTATYTASTGDIANGKITDTATASGTAPGGGVVQATATAMVTVTANPQIALTKSASATSLSGPGTVTYTFTATNPGNETLTGVKVTDSANFTGLSAITCGTNTNGSFSLAPGASATCTATEAVNQGAIDAGASLVDTGTAVGTTPSGVSPATVSANSAQVTVTIAQSSTLTLTKSASVTSVSAAGTSFTYSFLVTNTGNTDESSITIHDTQTPPSVASDLTNLSCPNASLAPGANETCTATYTVSQPDMDAGSINDAATATGTVGNATITSNSSKAAVTAAQGGAITLTKTAS
ncbi:MAG TPA: hypothetical protein VGF87_03865, partial [Acidimicrobiales bacterium]